jgi:predicted NUDIX family NTP pyrophosphohydrolase
MPKRSAGLLMYRRSRGTLEVLLVHPGGPFWEKKDLGRRREFPEVDHHAGWFSLEEARRKILSAQAGLLDELAVKMR